MTQKFGRVLITNIFDTLEKGLSRIPITTEEDYKKYLKSNKGAMCDLKFHASIKYIIDSFENGITIQECSYSNKNELELIIEENNSKALKVNTDLAQWICNRYINKKKKNKHFNQKQSSKCRDMNIIIF